MSFTNKGWRQLGPHPICKITRAHTWPNEIYLLAITCGWNELKNAEQLAPLNALINLQSSALQTTETPEINHRQLHMPPPSHYNLYFIS